MPAMSAPSPVDPAPAPVKQGVGYKSLIEANANRVQNPQMTPTPSSEPLEQPAKGNRFFRAVGKIFKGPKKDGSPLALQPNQ